MMITFRCFLAKLICLNAALAFLAVACLIDSSRAFAAPQVSDSRAASAPVHVFLPPQPEWITHVSYQKYLGEDQGYEGVQPTEQDIQSQRYYKEIRYFKNAEDANDPNKECKVLLYNTQGHLQDEIDRVGPDVYDRECYTDGFLCIYTHMHTSGLSYVTGLWVDGFSMSPLKKMVSHFSGGSGELISGGRDGHTYHRWYFHGSEYLEKELAQHKCCKVRLNGPPSVDYQWTPQEETLWSESLSEFWIKLNGRPPYNALPIFRVRSSILSRRKEDKNEEAALDAKLTLEYSQRRARFMTTYGALLIAAGQSWKDLGLEGIRDGTGAPK
jgi:hypothetical protein